jgi:hypothetical protein
VVKKGSRFAIFILFVALAIAWGWSCASAECAKDGPKPDLTTHIRYESAYDWIDALSKGVVYDNGMIYQGLGSSQDDHCYDFDPIIADDFTLAGNSQITGVCWIGGYWNGPPYDGDFDWQVVFYTDFGDGSKPGAAVGTYFFPNADVNETFLDTNMFGSYNYSYQTILPTPLNLAAGIKYWISIQGMNDYPPQSGWAYHVSPILSHQAVFKSVYFGYPDWVDISTLFTYPGDMCFQLTGEEPPPPELDFGDAPAPTFPTLLINDGARHVYMPNICLGATIDLEPDGQPDPNALGDDNDGTDDEDGVVFTSLLYPGTPAKVKVTASVLGYLDAWMDFNADGDWDDPQEKIFTSKLLVAGANDLFYGVPTDAVAGPAISRFRFSTAGGLGYTGQAPDGEVEDYEVDIMEPIGDIKMHYLQPPDLEGWDILATYPYVVADDWLCTETGPVTDIHFWGSWASDLLDVIDYFVLSIYSNESGPTYSQPGYELWQRSITDFEETPMEPFPQGWYDTYYMYSFHPNHEMWFRYDITGIEEPFIQEEGTIYWLSIRAVVRTFQYPLPPLWGWKNSYEHFGGNAIWGYFNHVSYWGMPLTVPLTQLPLDMAFAITSSVPGICGDANNDEAVNLTDAIYLLNYLFKGGSSPTPYLCVGDVNNDDVTNLTDAIYILNYLFKGGAEPNPDCCNPTWSL